MKHILFILLFTTFSCNAVGQKLYIFIPTEYSAIEVEKNFRERYKDYTIRSFSNVIDFTKAVSIDTPDAVITKPQLLPILSIYNIKLNATYSGSTKESFFVLSVENPLTLTGLTSKNIGILDFLGRKYINTFTDDLFDGNPKLKRVKKIADLVPLLTMNLVDGVIVSASQLAYIKSRSQLSFHKTKCKNDQDIAVLALLKESEEIVKRLKQLPAELALMIGVDGWK